VAGTWHTLRLVFTGTLIEVYLDGVWVLSVTDTAYPSGVIALDVSNQPMEFDNVLVTGELSASNPLPTTTSLNPASATAGGPGFTLTVNGGNFINGSVVRWNGANRVTTYISSTQLQAAIPATDIAVAGTAQVTVSNPASGGGQGGAPLSNALTFTIN
jgi:hypothetical protein